VWRVLAGTGDVQKKAAPEEKAMVAVRIRPVGGGSGCLLMILVSVAVSILLTVVLNMLI
jgi:hypothetical protein